LTSNWLRKKFLTKDNSVLLANDKSAIGQKRQQEPDFGLSDTRNNEPAKNELSSRKWWEGKA